MWGPGHDPVETALEQKRTEFCIFFFIEIQQPLSAFFEQIFVGSCSGPVCEQFLGHAQDRSRF